eukprot:scaffold30870_cov36-Tisochrysis_lutea.AAC.1
MLCPGTDEFNQSPLPAVGLTLVYHWHLSHRRLCLQEAESNSYLYELDASELASRGYNGPCLRISALASGGLARFVNDAWAPLPLPRRKPNAYVDFVFDPRAGLPMLVLFASRAIPQGGEVLLDYGPAYWRVAARTLIREHAMACADALTRIAALRGALDASNRRS